MNYIVPQNFIKYFEFVPDYFFIHFGAAVENIGIFYPYVPLCQTEWTKPKNSLCDVLKFEHFQTEEMKLFQDFPKQWRRDYFWTLAYARFLSCKIFLLNIVNIYFHSFKTVELFWLHKQTTRKNLQTFPLKFKICLQIKISLNLSLTIKQSTRRNPKYVPRASFKK